MRKGIALFSTLLILVLVIMLMSISLKNSTNIKTTTLQDRYLIQENITVTDLITLIEKKIIVKLKDLNAQNRAEIQKTLFDNPITILDPVTNSTIEVIMYPNDGKQNINFINNTDGKKYIKKIFNSIGVLEPEILSNIILANITNNEEYSDDYKIHLKNNNKGAGYIKNEETFEQILDTYVQNTDDQEAYNINFKKYFNFYKNIEQNYSRFADNVLDINFIEVQLIDNVVNLNNDVRKKIQAKKSIFYQHSQLELEESERQDVSDHGFGYKTNNILLEININSINNKVEYMLNYNLETQKISNISMDRWIY